MEYTLTQLAEKVAGAVDLDIVKTVSRRIESFQASRLFKFVQVDVGPDRLGRGRVRKYPEEAVRWARLWNALADQDTGLIEMAAATQFLASVLAAPFIESGWLE